jgi:hypothetical protein
MFDFALRFKLDPGLLEGPPYSHEPSSLARKQTRRLFKLVLAFPFLAAKRVGNAAMAGKGSVRKHVHPLPWQSFAVRHGKGALAALEGY